MLLWYYFAVFKPCGSCEMVVYHLIIYFLLNQYLIYTLYCLNVRWEKYQSEEEAALGRGKRQRKAVSYREAYAPHASDVLSEVLF